METLIILTAMGIFSVLIILAISRVDDALAYFIAKSRLELEDIIRAEHKKTRKETQEIKTRLTQVRKDLNVIEIQTSKIGEPNAYELSQAVAYNAGEDIKAGSLVLIDTKTGKVVNAIKKKKKARIKTKI